MNEEQIVWAPDKVMGFILARIVDISKDKLTLETVAEGIDSGKNSSFKESYNNVYLADPEITKEVDDNCCLIYLNPGTLLNNIRTRYFKDLIYTYVSNILIVINPYFDIPFLYSEETIRSYIGKSLGKNAPHAFAIAEKAFRDMKTFQKNQSIIISGESGSGKTECIKHVIKYLTHAYGNMNGTIEQRIMDSNPILEAFGNAKTTRNNNSSRFGKFVEIYFDDKYLVCGGLVSHYLLEKSRTCSHGKDDRNYHIFYQLCIGSDQGLRQRLKLGNVADYKILQQQKIHYFLSTNSAKQLESECPSILEGLQKHGLNNYENGDILVDDYADFHKTDQCLAEIGMSKGERFAVYGIVAAILHLGNIQFQTSPDDPKGGCDISPNSLNTLNWVAELLGLDRDDLQRSLTYRMIASKASKGTVIQIPLKVSESSSLRDSFAKTVYSKLFDNVCQSVNDSIPFASSKRFIGILDIAGFEFFIDNGFEQFCINYCNEKMQHYFNHVVLEQEQEIYKQEGLHVKKVHFYDDHEVISLMEAKSIGILDLLDEENKLTMPNAVHFTEMVHQNHSSNPKLGVPRKSILKIHKTMLDQEGFVIRHYAGAVCYNTKHFIEKNNDALHFSLTLLLQESKNGLMQKLFPQNVVENGGSPKLRQNNISFNKSRNDSSLSKPVKGKLIFQSVSGKFKEQLKSLIQKFTESNTSFIKCIKPNASMKKHLFEGRSTLNQLESCGTMEVLSLMEHGFPSRISTNDLYGRYKHLLPSDLASLDIRLFLQCLFKSVGLSCSDFMFGTSKVFFRSGKFAEFDELVRNDPTSLQQIIHRLKKWILRCHWKKVQWCVLCAIKLKNKIVWRRDNSILIQKNIRMHLTKAKYKHRYQALIELKKLEEQTAKLPVLIEKLQKEKEVSLSKLSDIRDAMAILAHQIKNNELFEAKEIKTSLDDLGLQLHLYINYVQEQLARQCKEMEAKRLKEIQLQMEKEKMLQLKREKEREEEKLKREQEKSYHSSFQTISYVSENQNEQITENMAAMRLEDDSESQRKEILARQEKRDLDLAIRLSQPLENSDQRSPTHEVSNTNPPRDKYNLSSWKYIELRDTINTSCDLELLEACREEFHRRLKVYHEWKMRNKRSKSDTASLSNEVNNDTTRIPSQLINYPNHIHQNGVLKNETHAQTKSIQHRYYRVPFWQNSSLGVFCNKGWWYAHFHGNWVVRQMELYENKEPLLLTAGKDDMQMCELSLDETGLKNKMGAEIIPQEFDTLWSKLGGIIYKY